MKFNNQTQFIKSVKKAGKLLGLLPITIALTMTGCDEQFYMDTNKQGLTNKQMKKLILQDINEKERWSANIQVVMDTLDIPKSKENVCQIMAVVDQESNYKVNPSVPNLGQATLKAMEDKINHYAKQLGPAGAIFKSHVKSTLENKPTSDNNYIYQIKGVKTEKDLYLINQQLVSDLTVSVDGMLKPIGVDLKQEFNFVETIGSMQVHTEYAIAHKRQLISDNKLIIKIFNHYDGLYYGIHRLMVYAADYDKPIYRFADYNSGIYSSRNAGFQKMLMTLTGKEITLDGDLLNYGKLSTSGGESAQLLQNYFKRFEDAPSNFWLKRDLQKEKLYEFQETDTYKFIAEKYQQNTGKKPIYAVIPQVQIQSSKIKRDDLNTNWYARNVNIRYKRCMARIV